MDVVELINGIDIIFLRKDVEKKRAGGTKTNRIIATGFAEGFSSIDFNVSGKAMLKTIPVIGKALYVVAARDENKAKEQRILALFLQQVAYIAMTYNPELDNTDSLRIPAAYALAQYFVPTEDLNKTLPLDASKQNHQEVQEFCKEIFALVKNYYLSKGATNIAGNLVRAVPVPILNGLLARQLNKSATKMREGKSISGSDLCSTEHLMALVEAYETFLPSPEEPKRQIDLRLDKFLSKLPNWYQDRNLLYLCLILSFLLPVVTLPLAFNALDRTSLLSDKAKHRLKIAYILWSIVIVIIAITDTEV